MSATILTNNASLVKGRRVSVGNAGRSDLSRQSTYALSSPYLRRGQSRQGVIMSAKKADLDPVNDEEDEDEEYEEVEEEIEETIVEEVPENKITIKTVQEVAPKLWDKPVVRNGAYTVGAVLGATLLWSCWKVFQKWR